MENMQKYLKTARENQILGNYGDSICEYKLVLDMIKVQIGQADITTK